MEVTLNICLTCLSTDRCLVPLHKITTFLQETYFIQLKDSHGGICWECQSILAKFYRFKKKAKIAQETLSRTTEPVNIKPLTTLTSKTNSFYDYQYTYSLDPLTSSDTKLKTEPDSIKQEIIDQSENIDNTSDFEEKKTDLDEGVKIFYDNVIETKHSDTYLRKQEIKYCIEVANDGDSVDDITDVDEKIPDIPEKIEKVYVDVIENKRTHNAFKKHSQVVNKVKINKVSCHEQISESTENLYIQSIKKKHKKHLQNRKVKRDTEKDLKEFQEKFVRVVLSEEEMLKARDRKRYHHNFKKLPYKCDSCVLGFTRKDTYSLHLRKKHDESIGDQICDVCSIRFRHKIALNNHKSKHYVVYRCRLCRYEAHEYVSAANHCKMKHAADKPDSIHCSQCNVVVKTPDDLEKHIQTEHSLFCDCGIKFKDKNNLRRHMSRAHSILRNFICDICTKTFKTKTRLETHMGRHSGYIAKKLAYCQQCNVQYKSIQVYRIHLKSSANHSEGRKTSSAGHRPPPSSSTSTGSVLPTSSALLELFFILKTERYPCSECNKKFKSKGYLKQHFDFYHLRKSQFTCEVCNKLFISNWRLRNHKQLYHGLSRPRNHSCNTCGKKFFTLATLRSHQFTHSDQRSFMCEDCGDTFKQSAALYNHTRLVHKGGEARKKRDS